MNLQVGEDVTSTAVIQFREPDTLVPFQQLKEVKMFCDLIFLLFTVIANVFRAIVKFCSTN